MKQAAPHCDRNQAPILEVLKHEFAEVREVLEIGAGNGQHAACFAAGLPHLTWQPSDLVENHASIRAWGEEAGLANLREPIELDLERPSLPAAARFDGFFTANTFHFMAWRLVESFFEVVGLAAAPGAVVCVYGPFNYGGRFTSPGNEAFDARLRGGDPARGIRDFEKVDALAQAKGMLLRADHEMPANNRILVWINKGHA